MKMKLTMIPAMLSLATAGLMSAGGADAATKINGDIQTFTKEAPQQLLNARPDSFYNLTMGYQGWTHHSAWGNVRLRQGNLYKITVETTNPQLQLGFHPAVAVWFRPQGAGLVPNTFAYDHFYNQWANIIATNVTNEDGGARLGTLRQLFIVNGVDRDGWAETDESIYDQGNVVRILDGVNGRVQVEFVARNSGWHQFVVGGINPNPPLNTAPGLTVKYPVKVTVEGL